MKNRFLISCSLPIFSAKTDPDFKAFLDERNPKQQHSSTLESYLIKPIQRVLKYPLLLRELYSLTDPDSEEHYHLDGKTRSRGLTGDGEIILTGEDLNECVRSHSSSALTGTFSS